jgi:uncharacterized RDD family membrane protein YckC
MVQCLLAILSAAFCAGLALWGACFFLVGGIALVGGAVSGDLAEGGLTRGLTWIAVSGVVGALAAQGARASWRRYDCLKPPAPELDGRPLAGAGRRLAACGIDSCLMIPLYGLCLLIPGAGPKAALLNLPLFPYFLYVVLLIAWRGQTLGKLALGIKVLRADGSPPGFGTALRRSAPDILWAVLALFANFRAFDALDLGTLAAGDYLSIAEAMEKADPRIGWVTLGAALWYAADVLRLLITPERQSLHDALAGTLAVQEGDGR